MKMKSSSIPSCPDYLKALLYNSICCMQHVVVLLTESCGAFEAAGIFQQNIKDCDALFFKQYWTLIAVLPLVDLCPNSPRACVSCERVFL